MITVIDNTINQLGNSLRTTIRLATAIAVVHASLGIAKANELACRMIGTALGWTKHFNPMLRVSEHSALCFVDLNFRDRKGNCVENV